MAATKNTQDTQNEQNQPTQAGQTSTNAPTQAKNAEYVCVEKCYWNKQLFNTGDTVTVPDGTEVPEHFKKV